MFSVPRSKCPNSTFKQATNLLANNHQFNICDNLSIYFNALQSLRFKECRYKLTINESIWPLQQRILFSIGLLHTVEVSIIVIVVESVEFDSTLYYLEDATALSIFLQAHRTSPFPNWFLLLAPSPVLFSLLLFSLCFSQIYKNFSHSQSVFGSSDICISSRI
jgi:hypothetical protein